MRRKLMRHAGFRDAFEAVVRKSIAEAEARRDKGAHRHDASVRLACGCGNFVLSFRRSRVRRGIRFRCLICGRELRLPEVEALQETHREPEG